MLIFIPSIYHGLCLTLPGLSLSLPLSLFLSASVPTPANPCRPSPCGPFSACRVVDGHAACSCAPGFVGAPPQCRPECVVSAECPQDRACTNQRCVDPCPGVCGANARCQALNHQPVCTCAPGYTGDPFTRCLMPDRKSTPTTPNPPGMLFA